MNDVVLMKFPQADKTMALDKVIYQNLIKFCPELARLEEGEYRAFKSPRNSDIIIGCVHQPNATFENGIYDIIHPQEEGKAILTFEASHREKAASAMLLKEQGKLKNIEDNYFYKLLKDMERKNYVIERHSQFERA